MIYLNFVTNFTLVFKSFFSFCLLDKEDAKHDPNLKHNALLVWAPVDEIPNSKCKYCNIIVK